VTIARDIVSIGNLPKKYRSNRVHRLRKSPEETKQPQGRKYIHEIFGLEGV